LNVLPLRLGAWDIGAWLRGLGLDRYESAFRENDIDAEVPFELTPEDLTALGVTSIGHRRKLLAAIAMLRAEPGTTLRQPRTGHLDHSDRSFADHAQRAGRSGAQPGCIPDLGNAPPLAPDAKLTGMAGFCALQQ
jgi:hypothetical protein